MNKIYLDHSATTPVAKEVLADMLPFFTEIYGNGSSQHFYGREALKAIDIARRQVADSINCNTSEIFFTSGGTESDNWAVKGVCEAYGNKGKHLITTCIEHPAMIKTFKNMEKLGFEVTYLGVDSDGLINLDELKAKIRKDTILISIMTVNNEIGTIQDVLAIGEIAKEHKILFHTDAVQAIGSIAIDVKKLNIDLLSMSAHKFYGPKGVGALYKRTGVKLGKLMNGGEQERSMRPGTLNTPGIVGMGSSVALAVKNLESNQKHIKGLRDEFVELVQKRIANVYLNGSASEHKVASNANFSFEFIEGESILMRLDLEGIAVSSGSACSSGSLEPSYVLLATNRDIALAHGSIRFSFGKDNTKEEVLLVVNKLEKIVASLREMSPLFLQLKGENHYV